MVTIGASDARERLIADSQFGGGSTSWAPATWYLGLSTSTPNDDGSGFSEPTGGAYARVVITNNATNFLAASTDAGGVTTKRNGTKFTFPNPSATWGIISHYGFFTAPTGGTPEYTNPLDTSITVRNGNTPVEFDLQQLTLVFD